MTKPAAGALPFKEGRSIAVKTDNRLRFTNFSGEMMVKHADNGRALLWFRHDDGHIVWFDAKDWGWEVA